MPKMIPVHAVHVGRPNPAGRKNKEGEVIHDTIRPKIGEPFDFTHEELADINAATPGAVREPVNEGGNRESAQESAADLAEREAVERSFQNRSAPGDAARVARAGAVGKGKRNQSSNTDRGEAPGSDAVAEGVSDEEDEL